MVPDHEFCSNRVRLFGFFFLWRVRCYALLPRWNCKTVRVCPKCGARYSLPARPVPVKIPRGRKSMALLETACEFAKDYAHHAELNYAVALGDNFVFMIFWNST